ncbi:MAG: hypothetical protein ABII25_08390 [bacterium]
MKKLSIVMLAAVVIMGLAGLSSAADVKIGGKVDVRQNLGGLDTTETGYNMKAFNLREARLTVEAAITDKVSAQISNNFGNTSVSTLEASNTGIGNTCINMALGDGNLMIGQMSLPGFAIRETILNKAKLSDKLTDDNITQVCYTGKADAISYAIAIVDGGKNTKGATTKDAVVNIGADVSGAKLGVTYSFDSNDDDAVKRSFFAANVGYALNPVDLTIQYIGGLDETVVGTTDMSDATKSGVKSEIVLDVGYNVSDKYNVSVGYDMYGKSNAIILKSNCKIADGVTGTLRADMLGSDYKKVSPIANNISLGVAVAF